jgi:apolipoprotein D and lipocalin family protein
MALEMRMRMRRLACAIALALGSLAAAPALAGQVQPTKPVPANLYSGRWYEIARTPNKLQAGCVGSTTDFSGWRAGAFSVVQTCHKGALTGPTKVISVRGRILPACDNTKMQLAMLGGLITQQYWVLDHADDNSWLIMTTPNGRYVWLMARQPELSGGAKAVAMARLQSLGFDLARLVFPQEGPG